MPRKEGRAAAECGNSVLWDQPSRAMRSLSWDGFALVPREADGAMAKMSALVGEADMTDSLVHVR